MSAKVVNADESSSSDASLKKKVAKRAAPQSAEDLAAGAKKPVVPKQKSDAKPKPKDQEVTMFVDENNVDDPEVEAEADEEDDAVEESSAPKRKRAKVVEPIVKGQPLPDFMWIQNGRNFLRTRPEDNKISSKMAAKYDMFARLINKLRSQKSEYFASRDSLLLNFEHIIIIADRKSLAIAAFVQLLPSGLKGCGIIHSMQVFEPLVGIGSMIIQRLQRHFYRGLYAASFFDADAGPDAPKSTAQKLFDDSISFWNKVDVQKVILPAASKQKESQVLSASLVDIKDVSLDILMEQLWRRASSISGSNVDDDEEYPGPESKKLSDARGVYCDHYGGRHIQSAIYEGVKVIDTTSFDAINGAGSFASALKAAVKAQAAKK